MREYHDLAEMLYQEASVENSRQKAEELEDFMSKTFPEFEAVILFVEPYDPSDAYHLTVPVPYNDLRCVEEVEGRILESGHYPVAYWVKETQSTAI